MDYSLLLVIEEVEGEHILEKEIVIEKNEDINMEMSKNSKSELSKNSLSD